jgi:Zn-dependent protease/CBS domain-containing protein
MKRHTIPLGSLFGIPLELDLSWFLIFALLTWIMAVGYYPAEFKNWSTATYWVLGAVTSVMLFVCVVLHELGHSLLARRYKIRVQRITLFIFGGVSQITAEPPSASAEFWISIAGPLVSFALALIFTAGQLLFPAASPPLALAKYLAFINGTLALFNLIPGFPLDGGRVLQAIIWGATRNFDRAARIAIMAGRFIAFAFILVGVWQIIGGNWASGLWIAFIGWFLESAAASQAQQQAISELLAGHKVSEVMSRDFTSISPDTPLQHLVDEEILGRGHRSFIVHQNGEGPGFLTLDRIRNVPRQDWAIKTAGQAMTPFGKLNSARPDEDLVDALKEIQSDGDEELPVVEGNRIVGVISRDSLVQYIRKLHDLKA